MNQIEKAALTGIGSRNNGHDGFELPYVTACR